VRQLVINNPVDAIVVGLGGRERVSRFPDTRAEQTAVGAPHGG